MVVVGYRSIGAEVDGKDLAERERALPDPLPAVLVVLAGKATTGHPVRRDKPARDWR
jgi:hypothetical protein